MRRQLNLNRYYEDLELEEVNQIFSRMMDLKPVIDSLEYIYETFDNSEQKKTARALNESTVRYKTKKMDKILIAKQKESIFGTENIEKFTEEDFKTIVEKYRYLMADKED